MSIEAPSSEADEHKLPPLRVYNESKTTDRVTFSKPSLLEVNNGYLSAPSPVPIRSLSPDTLSNVSLDEYDQLSRTSTRSGNPESPIDATHSLRQRWKHSLTKFWVRNKGCAYVLLGQVFGVLMNVTARLLEVEGNRGRGLHPFQILFARMSITLLLASGYMWYKQTPYFPLGMPDIRKLLMLRGLGGFCGVFGMYYSLLYLPLADATVITFLAPSLACWACSILLKEPFTRVEQIVGLISLTGVVLIAQPTTLFFSASPRDSSPSTVADGLPPGKNSTTSASDVGDYERVTPAQRLTAVGVSLIGVLGTALAYTSLRWIGKRAHPLISVNYFAAWCFLVSVVAQSVLKEVGWVLPASLKEWGYLLFLGTCGFVMQFLLSAGLAYEKSSRATNMTYTSMLFALLFDKVIFNHTPDVMSLIGSSLILGSAIVVALQANPERLQAKDGVEDCRGYGESRVSLVDAASDVETGESSERRPMQEVQLRTLR